MDFYRILGVKPNATPDEIRRAYRQKAKQLHPDLNRRSDAETRFKELQQAYNAVIGGTAPKPKYPSYESRDYVQGGSAILYRDGYPMDNWDGSMFDSIKIPLGAVSLGGVVHYTFRGKEYRLPFPPGIGQDHKLILTFTEMTKGKPFIRTIKIYVKIFDDPSFGTAKNSTS